MRSLFIFSFIIYSQVEVSRRLNGMSMKPDTLKTKFGEYAYEIMLINE